MTDRLPRKLAAILYADVADYSRLTGEDEDTTHRTLSDYLDLISTTIESHHGQVKHYAGDAVLAKFDAVVDAMSAAVAIQDELKTRNQDVPDDRKVQFRVGVNLGDVIEDRGDIYGDGVNIAARLESLADPGGICISESVCTAVGKKLDLDYEDMGEQKVKNVEQPVRSYKVVMGVKVESKSPKPALEVPDKPSIGVLPFNNMSGDPEQEYFSDGMTEDIITTLSNIPKIFVIARTSTFRYKGKTVDIKEVGREQGVRYVLEGSVRKIGNRVRVTAQMIEVETGGHIWSERYDRNLNGIFEVQDEITQAIVVALQIQLTAGETARLLADGTKDLAAWEAVNSGIRLMENYTRADNRHAQRLFTEALQHDPNYLEAKVFLAFSYWLDNRFSYVADTDRVLKKAKEIMKEIEASGRRSTGSENVNAIIALIENRHDVALVAARAAVDLGPNDPWALLILGEVQIYCGEPRVALESLLAGMRLSPYGLVEFEYYLAYAYMWLDEHANSIDAARNYAMRMPNEPFAYTLLACVYAFAGRKDQAKTAVATLRAKHPTFAVDSFTSTQFYRDVHQIDRLADMLHQAGLPEHIDT